MAKRKEIQFTFEYYIDGKQVTKEYFIEQLKLKHNK